MPEGHPEDGEEGGDGPAEDLSHDRTHDDKGIFVTTTDGTAASRYDDGAPDVARTGPQDGALRGRRVLVPRGGEWGDKVAGLLEAHGAEAVVVPLIEFAPPTELTALDSVLGGLARGEYDWLVITSGTTVMSLSARVATLANRGRETPVEALRTFVGDTAVAAVGPGTAAALERAGISAALVPSGERSARGLLAEFPAPDGDDAPASLGRPGKVLLPHSDLAEPTLADGLRAMGWEVDAVVAYRTLSGPMPGEALRAEVRQGAFDAVLLSSASTVTNLLELVGAPPEPTIVCCIGPRTSSAAAAHGLPVHVVPETASAEALVDALVRHVQEGRERGQEETA